MDTNYLRAAAQFVGSLRSPIQLAEERRADAIRGAFQVAAITGTFPQIDNIPDYSKTPEVQEAQRIYEEKVNALVGHVVKTNREACEAEAAFLFNRPGLKLLDRLRVAELSWG